MSALNRVCQLDNLRTAWQRVRSDPRAEYKSYFRPLYANFAAAEDGLLRGLRDRLRRGTYEPAHTCKVHLPKASGGLRHTRF